MKERKTCRGCLKEFPLTKEYFDVSSKESKVLPGVFYTHFQSKCKSCRREETRIRNNKRYHENEEWRKEFLRKDELKRRKKGALPLDEHRLKNYTGLTKSEYSKKWKSEHPEKVTEYQKRQRAKKVISGENKWRASDYRKRIKADPELKEKADSYYRNLEKKRRDNLEDAYVKRIFVANTNISVSEISSDIVKLKRKQLTLTRIIKQNQNGKVNKQDHDRNENKHTSAGRQLER